MRDASGSGAREYQLFGLRVRSELALPELFPAHAGAEPDVTIRTGAVAAADDGPGLHVHEGGLVLVVHGVARFRVEQGKAITVDPEPGVPDRNVRLYLLGSAFGAVLHQRGLLPLHANAVEIDGKAIAFMGPSGEGKSTLAAWFHDRGHRVIADDVCVIGFDAEGAPYTAPGLPRLRLWTEALELMGRDAVDYDRSYVGALEQLDKFDVPIAAGAAAQRHVPLAGLYVLARSDRFSVQRVNGIDAADAVIANTYRGAYVYHASGQRRFWQSAVRIVRTTPVFVAAREWALADLDRQSRLLFDHAASLVSAGGS